MDMRQKYKLRRNWDKRENLIKTLNFYNMYLLNRFTKKLYTKKRNNKCNNNHQLYQESDNTIII